jgi:hypothetical protein
VLLRCCNHRLPPLKALHALASAVMAATPLPPKTRAFPLPLGELPEPAARLPLITQRSLLRLVVQTKRHAGPVPAGDPRAVVLRLTASGRRLGVGGAQRDRAAAHGVAGPRLLGRELAGAGDLVPQLVDLPE